ncbi:hypothetical protein VNO77_26940 [Canavalia gladiata]|uniref:Uncharacterized protein n=1 Tax=Canavalia gladiata TaxID=3824 RepID=A0AAN9Q610_CANGL
MTHECNLFGHAWALQEKHGPRCAFNYRRSTGTKSCEGDSFGLDYFLLSIFWEGTSCTCLDPDYACLYCPTQQGCLRFWEWIVVTDASKLASCSDIFRSGKKKIPGLPALLVETCDGRLHKDCKLTISLEAEDFSRRYRHMTVGISVAGQQTDFLSMLETNLDGPVKIAEV